MGVFDTTQTTTTTMPSWFTDAQKALAQQAGSAASGAMPFAQTQSGSGALQNLMGQQNPFMGAIGSLQDIAQGAANPWLANGDPNTQTALGGLFAAQKAQLDQMLPSITAKEGAAGIGSGAFGSLRGQTATQTARGGALTTMAADQMKAALDAQQQAIQANSAIGNIGSQYGALSGDLGKLEMEGNLSGLAQYANILGSMGPTLNQTKTQVSSGSQMSEIAKALQLLQSSGSPINNVLTGNTGVPWLDEYLKKIGSSAVGWLGNTWDSIYDSLFGNNGYASWNGIDDYIS